VGSRELGLYPQARVLHRVSGAVRGNTYISQFAVIPITAPRPVAGDTTVTQVCPQCGVRLTLRIWSQTDTRRRRIAWLALAALGVVVLPILIANFGQGDTSAPGGLVALVASGAIVAVVGGLVLWWKEDGVRLVEPPSADESPTTVLVRAGHELGFPIVGERVYTRR
jgi:Zn ribbon nucleic-acid-binding protein